MDTLLSFGRKNIVPLLLFLSFLLLYSATASRSIVQGDNAEFVTIAAVGGIPHEPGYPLYSLLTRIAFLLPFGNPTWQVNAFSSICGAGAVLLVYLITVRLTKNTWAALVAALTLGFSESFWWYSITAEVYALQIFLQALMTIFLLLSYQSKQLKYFYAAAFVFGLGITNHYTVVFMFPLFLLVLSQHTKTLVKTIIIAALFCILGLSPYLYTPFASSPYAILNWGRITDLSSFFKFLFRSDLGLFQFGTKEPPVPTFYYSWFFFYTNLFVNSWYILPAFVASFYFFSKKNLPILSLVSCWLLFGPVFFLLIAVPERSIVHIANSTQYVSYAYFFFAILAGIGVHNFMQKIHPKDMHPFAWRSVLMVLFVLFFSLPFFQTLQKVREDHDTVVAQITKQQLSLVPKNGILLVWSDSLYFPALSMQYVEQYRRDITIIQLGLINIPWYQANLIQQYPYLKPFLINKTIDYKKICDTFAAKDKVYMYPWYAEFDQAWQKGGCTQIPYGPIIKIVKNTPQDVHAIRKFTDQQMQKLEMNLGETRVEHANGYFRKRETLFYLSEHVNYIGIYAMQQKNYDWALQSFLKATALSPDQTNAYIGISAILHARNQDSEAIRALKEGIERNPTTSGLYKNIAVLYQLQQNIPAAKENFSQYVSFSPQNDPELPKILQFIQNN